MKIRACEHLQNFCEHEQESTHLIFASNPRKSQILRALLNWTGPFYTPTLRQLLIIQEAQVNTVLFPFQKFRLRKLRLSHYFVTFCSKS